MAIPDARPGTASVGAGAAAPDLPGGVRRGYALGGVASGTFGTVPGLLLMPYLTDVIGIGAALAGLVVFVPKAWDFFMNPVAGRISDRSTNPNGHRRPIMLRAGLAMAACFALIFCGPTTGAGLATAWVVLVYLAGATAYAFFQVPYLAMSAEITDDYSERTRLMTWRVVVITLAILVSGGSAPLLVEAADGAAGYRLMGVVMAVLIGFGAVGVWWGTRKAVLSRAPASHAGLGAQVRIVLSNVHARSLLTAFVLQAVALTMVLAGISYTARWVMGDASIATYAFIAFVGPAIIVAPLWGRVGVRWGKKAGLVACTLVLVVGLVLLTFTHEGNLPALLATSAIVGVGYAGAQLFPLAMLPDVAAHDAKESGENRIGLLTGTWSGFELLGFATGPFAYGLVLQFGGFSSGAQAQSAAAQEAIIAGVSWIPALLVLLSLVAIRGYKLDEELRPSRPVPSRPVPSRPLPSRPKPSRPVP